MKQSLVGLTTEQELLAKIYNILGEAKDSDFNNGNLSTDCFNAWSEIDDYFFNHNLIKLAKKLKLPS